MNYTEKALSLTSEIGRQFINQYILHGDNQITGIVVLQDGNWFNVVDSAGKAYSLPHKAEDRPHARGCQACFFGNAEYLQSVLNKTQPWQNEPGYEHAPIIYKWL